MSMPYGNKRAICAPRPITFGGRFDVAAKQTKAADLENRMSAADFWNHQERANQVIRELKILNGAVKPYASLEGQLGDLDAMVDLADEAGGDDEMLPEINATLEKVQESLSQLEFQAMMTEEADPLNAFVTIQAALAAPESAIGPRCSLHVWCGPRIRYKPKRSTWSGESRVFAASPSGAANTRTASAQREWRAPSGADQSVDVNAGARLLLRSMSFPRLTTRSKSRSKTKTSRWIPS